MEKTSWTSAEIRKLFKMDERHKSVQALYNAEERGAIPKAHRISRGKIKVRNWNLAQLPIIGQKFGFLSSPEKQVVICKYIQKGGVLKTTTSYNEARTFALNGIKTLIVGLDFECSITDVILPRNEILKLEDNEKPLGLYHLIVENAPFTEVIKKTSLPTLDIIPETHDLVTLDKWLNQEKRREYVFKDRLIPLLNDYEVIIFDNGPSWNHLIENSVVSSDVILCPLGCNLLAYNASETNLATIFEFQQIMKLDHQKIIMFATLLDRSSLSQQIYAQYLAKFSDFLIPIPIKISVKGQESLVHNQTILEYAPTSEIAQDYYELISAIWKSINSTPNYIKKSEEKLSIGA